MNSKLYSISYIDLLLAFIPVAITLILFIIWSLELKRTLLALLRMVIQLLTIGYCLTFIFNAQNSFIVLLILVVMIVTSSWISLGSLQKDRLKYLKASLISIFLGGGITLAIITQIVLRLDPWFDPRYMVPLAGMIFANCMNSISLAIDRFTNEIELGKTYIEARNTAYRTSLLPVTNSLLAVGLVSIPGMMTGQILSGVDPLIASRYQMIVMCMVFGSAGISSACLLRLCKNHTSSNT